MIINLILEDVQGMKGTAEMSTREFAADDYAVIRARLEELRVQRPWAGPPTGEVQVEPATTVIDCTPIDDFEVRRVELLSKERRTIAERDEITQQYKCGLVRCRYSKYCLIYRKCCCIQPEGDNNTQGGTTPPSAASAAAPCT